MHHLISTIAVAVFLTAVLPAGAQEIEAARANVSKSEPASVVVFNLVDGPAGADGVAKYTVLEPSACLGGKDTEPDTCADRLPKTGEVSLGEGRTIGFERAKSGELRSDHYDDPNISFMAVWPPDARRDVQTLQNVANLAALETIEERLKGLDGFRVTASKAQLESLESMRVRELVGVAGEVAVVSASISSTAERRYPNAVGGCFLLTRKAVHTLEAGARFGCRIVAVVVSPSARTPHLWLLYQGPKTRWEVLKPMPADEAQSSDSQDDAE